MLCTIFHKHMILSHFNDRKYRTERISMFSMCLLLSECGNVQRKKVVIKLTNTCSTSMKKCSNQILMTLVASNMFSKITNNQQ